MRTKINPRAVASSYRYESSIRVHRDWLRRQHEAFCLLAIAAASPAMAATVPPVPEKQAAIRPSASKNRPMRTITVFGRPMAVSEAEYDSMNLRELGF